MLLFVPISPRLEFPEEICLAVSSTIVNRGGGGGDVVITMLLLLRKNIFSTAPAKGQQPDSQGITSVAAR